MTALSTKGCALVLLRRTEEGAKLLEQERRHCMNIGYRHALFGSEGIFGVCKVLQGNVGQGVHLLQSAISATEKVGYRTAANWYRLFLSEIYLQIIEGNGKLSFPALMKNLPILMAVRVTASVRIRGLIKDILESPHFDPAGHHVGRAQMILGLLYKVKKKRALALKHLTEARRILGQFGQTPILTRVETALAELGHAVQANSSRPPLPA